MSERGPFGADTPDEVVIAYVNGRLSDAERAEVERWLDEHPAWRARLGSYTAIGNAVRHRGPASNGAPDIGSLGGLWAAIDAEGDAPAATTLPPPTAAPTAAPPLPPPPSSDNVVSLDARRRRPRWLLGAAAAAALVAGAAVVVAQRGGEDGGDTAIEDVQPEPDAGDAGATGEAPTTDAELGEAPGDGEDGDAAGEDTRPQNQAVPGPDEEVVDQQAWREVAEAVEATRASGTARLAVQIVATLDLSGTQWEDPDGETDLSGAGTGVIDLVEGAALDVELTNVDGQLWPDGTVRGEVLQLANGDTYVRCEGEDELRAVAPDESGCAFGAGLAPVDLFEVLDALTAAEGEVLRRGPDPDGLMGYLLSMELPIGGQPQLVEVHVYVDPDDGLIDFLRVYLPDGVTAEVPVGGADGEPTLVDAELLWVNVELSDHGEPVTLPDPD